MNNDPSADPIKEIFHVAGDAPDPEGIDPRARGFAPGYDLTKGATGHPMLLYRVGGQEIFLEVDVFMLPGAASHVILNCPKCLAGGRTVGLRIPEEKKPFSYDPDEVMRAFPGWSEAQMRAAFPRGHGGVLTVHDPIACTWEENPELSRASEGLGGFSRCGWKVAIERNVVRDVRDIR